MVRVGIGWDIHPLVEGRELRMGGIHFENEEKGLDGHSDADVVCHAVCDALLGALALGDIGEHFPDSDPAYKDMPGVKFLDAVCEKIEERWAEGREFAIVVVAEGAFPIGGEPLFKQTHDGQKRLGGMAEVVAAESEQVTGRETRQLVLGHLQRGGGHLGTDSVTGNHADPLSHRS